MKKSVILMLAAAVLVSAACGSSGNRSKTVHFEDDNDSEETTVGSRGYDASDDETSSYTRGAQGTTVYFNSYDGISNIREAPSTKAAKIGKGYNGESIQKVGEEAGWIAVDYNGTVGYVMKHLISYTPTQPVTSGVTTGWLQGVWESPNNDCYLFIYFTGKYAKIHRYGKICYGKFRLEGDDIVLTPMAIFHSEMGDLASNEKLFISKSSKRVGNFRKTTLHKAEYPDSYMTGGIPIDKQYFNDLKADVNKRVK
jgi:hypothetical protein